MADATGTRGRDMGMLRRMTAATAIGEGLDGFDLGIIAVVLPLITKDLGLTPVWSGLIAASTLVGIFFGSPIVGWLSDRIGRRTLFTIDIAAFVVLGLLQAVVTEPWQLLVVRLLLGVASSAASRGGGCSPRASYRRSSRWPPASRCPSRRAGSCTVAGSTRPARSPTATSAATPTSARKSSSTTTPPRPP